MALTGKKKEQGNRKEDADPTPHTLNYLVFDKGNEHIIGKKESLFHKYC